MSPQDKEMCPACKELRDIISVERQGPNVEVVRYSCGHPNVKVTVMAVISTAMKIKVKDVQGKEILETRVRGDIEKRISRKPKGAIQIVWKKDESSRPQFVHLHCKVCGNGWKIEESGNWSGKFEIEEVKPAFWHIKCKRCGNEYESG